MRMRLTAIDPGKLARRNRKCLVGAAHPTGPCRAKQKIMARIEAPLDSIVRRSPNMTGPQNGVKKPRALAAGGVKIGRQDARGRTDHTDSIIHPVRKASAWISEIISRMLLRVLR